MAEPIHPHSTSGTPAGTVTDPDGQGIIETRNGSNAVVGQFIHVEGDRRRRPRSEPRPREGGGRLKQYIDELVMIRVKDKGDLYVHQVVN